MAAPSVSPADGQASVHSQKGLSIRPQTLRLAPHYRRLRDALLRPQLRVTESRYFWERWKPRLGPDAAVLIMEVRDRCNRAMGMTALGAEVGLANVGTEGDGGCTVSAAELAAACGFSRVTLWRILQREEVQRFIRVEHNYVYDRRLGKKRRTLSTYHVLMEDPLVEEDEERLQQLLAANGESAEVATPPEVSRPTLQSEVLVVDKTAPRLQLETNRGGSDLKLQNVSVTRFSERLEQNDLGMLDRRATAGVRPTPATTRAIPEVDIWKKYPELAHHVEEAERLLQDRHSRGFYLKALKALYPGHMDIWQRSLALAREQQNIRRSRGALFTRLLRTFAAEAGVRL
jgi:hypothetical protein